MKVERGTRHAGGAGDVLHGRLAVAVLAEDAQCGIQDLFTPVACHASSLSGWTRTVNMSNPAEAVEVDVVLGDNHR
jgi:hypothetical protein